MRFASTGSSPLFALLSPTKKEGLALAKHPLNYYLLRQTYVLPGEVAWNEACMAARLPLTVRVCLAGYVRIGLSVRENDKCDYTMKTPPFASIKTVCENF